MDRLFRASIALGLLLAAAPPPAAPLAVAADMPAAYEDSSHATRGTQLPREEPFTLRPFRPFSGERWIGNAVCYGPFRDGQSPGGPHPTKEELRQDVHLLAKRWNLLRLYGASGPAETLLAVIREDRVDMQVMLGIWIDVEERRDPSGQVLGPIPGAREANRREIEAAVRLAGTYPEIVTSVSVGNETQVSWSSHRIPVEALIDVVREVRGRTQVPVTVADDFKYWIQPESRVVAQEIDFLVTHIHPLWTGQSIEDALGWTRRTYASLQPIHHDRMIVLGETGWATKKHDEGEQATLIRGVPGEEQQAAFYESLTSWAERERIPTFFFEAFDESWKGGPHPDEVEKHWGLYRSDRTPKKALAGDP